MTTPNLTPEQRITQLEEQLARLNTQSSITNTLCATLITFLRHGATPDQIRRLTDGMANQQIEYLRAQPVVDIHAIALWSIMRQGFDAFEQFLISMDIDDFIDSVTRQDTPPTD